MHDPMLNQWPDHSRGRIVIKAESQAVDAYQKLYRVVFADSADKQMAIQLKEPDLRSIIETGAALLGYTLQKV